MQQWLHGPIGRSGLGIRVPGWKLGVGRHPFKKVGIPRGRGFIPRGRGRGFVGRGGKFSYRDDDVNNLFREFREGIAYNDRRAPMGRGRGRRLAGGLRRGSFRDYTRHNDAYQSRTGPPLRQGEDFATRAAYGSRRGSLTRGGGRAGQSRRHSFPPSDGLFSRRLDRDLEHSRFRRGSYAYNDVSHGAKRPYAALDEDSRYVEPGSRGHTRARYDYSDPITSGARYPGQQTLASTYDGLGADSLGTSSGLYPSSYAGTRDYYGTDLGGSSYSSLYGGSRSLGSGSYY